MKRKRNTISLPLALVLVSAVANAQVLIKSNDKSIRYDLIKSGHYFEKQTLFDSTGRIANEAVTEYVVKVDSIRNEVLFIRSTQYAIGRLVIDSMVNNSAGSLTYSLTTIPVTKQEVIKYNSSSVDSHLYRKGKYSDKTTAMAEGYFDDTSIWELFGYMSFKKGLNYYLNCYGSDERLPLQYHVEYIFDDVIRQQNGAVSNCHVIHVTYPNASSYLWIDQQTQRTIKEASQYAKFGMSRVAI